MTATHDSPAINCPVDVLVVEDAPEFQQLVESLLSSEGYRVHLADSGEQAVELARRHDPDVVVLDVVLPGIDGIEVCRQLRTFTDAYVIMLTGRTEEVDKPVGLAVGADDYLTKPFSPRELAARIAVLLRRPRATTSSDNVRELGDLSIDIDAREMRVDGDAVDLTRIEFDLVATLSSKPQMVFERGLLLEQVWGPMWVGDDHVVDVHIANLRKKIDANGVKHIKTVRGIGYRMNVQP